MSVRDDVQGGLKVKTRRTALIAAILFLVTALPGSAVEIDVSALPTAVGPLPMASGDTLKLDLTGAYQLALARNLNLHVSRYDLAIADANAGKVAHGEVNGLRIPILGIQVAEQWK